MYTSQGASFGPSHVLGFNQASGLQIADFAVGNVTALYAYNDGLIVVDGDSATVDYYSYAGTLLHQYASGPALSGDIAYSSSSGGGGAVFVAGYASSPSCSIPSVERIGPTGVNWIWTSPQTIACSQTSLAATPDGGAILGLREQNAYISISPAGTTRWTHTPTAPKGAINILGSPVVDTAGHVAIPYGYTYTTSDSPQNFGTGVDFVTASSNVAAWTGIDIENSECSSDFGFELNDAIDIGVDRVYLGLLDTCQVNTPATLQAVSVPGLMSNFQLAVTTPQVPTPPCSSYDAALIGVRGSGDNSRGDAFPGDKALGVAQRLVNQYHLKLFDNDGGGDHVIGLAYPASSAAFPFLALPGYGVSVNSGAKNLLTEISGLRALCGTHFPILLVGYSQGAHVIHSALEQLDDAAMKTGDTRWQSIAGVALFASPRFQPLDATGRGTFVGGYPLEGIAGPSVIRHRFASVSRSYCLANDPVCNYSASNLLLNRSIHTKDYDACQVVSVLCPDTTPSGKLVADDAAGLLAWDVAHHAGRDLTPKPIGSLSAYRHLTTDRIGAAVVYADGSPTVTFAWDFNGDGRIDATTSSPWTTHAYGVTGGHVKTTVHITHADGRVTVRSICIIRRIVGAVTC